jgi:DNA-binding response OmpR family regulator
MHPRVLVVEDDPALLELVTRILQMEGYHVEAVSTSRAAQEAVRQTDHDVLLLDLILPDADGVLLHGRLRRIRPGIEKRTIFMTGFSSQPQVVHYLQSLCAVFLHKPFAASELVSAVGHVARRKDAAAIGAGSSRS